MRFPDLSSSRLEAANIDEALDRCLIIFSVGRYASTQSVQTRSRCVFHNLPPTFNGHPGNARKLPPAFVQELIATGSFLDYVLVEASNADKGTQPVTVIGLLR